jgi:hypothetical protein
MITGVTMTHALVSQQGIVTCGVTVLVNSLDAYVSRRPAGFSQVMRGF